MSQQKKTITEKNQRITAKIIIQKQQTREERARQLSKLKIKLIYENDKPIILSPKNYYISITHSKNIEAIVLSKSRVGIDIEHKNRILSEGLIKKLNIENHLAEEVEKNTLNDLALGYWLENESYFKMYQDFLYKKNNFNKTTITDYTNITARTKNIEKIYKWELEIQDMRICILAENDLDFIFTIYLASEIHFRNSYLFYERIIYRTTS